MDVSVREVLLLLLLLLFRADERIGRAVRM